MPCRSLGASTRPRYRGAAGARTRAAPASDAAERGRRRTGPARGTTRHTRFRSRSIVRASFPYRPGSPEPILDGVQRGEEIAGPEGRGDPYHAVDEVWLVGNRYRGRTVPARPRQDIHRLLGQCPQRLSQLSSGDPPAVSGKFDPTAMKMPLSTRCNELVNFPVRPLLLSLFMMLAEIKVCIPYRNTPKEKFWTDLRATVKRLDCHRIKNHRCGTVSKGSGKPMNFIRRERIAIFIDGSNLYSAARRSASTSITKASSTFFRPRDGWWRAFYYTAFGEDQEYSPIRPLVDWLDYNGYTLVTKPTKEFTDAMGRRKDQGQHGHRARHRRDGNGQEGRPHRPVLGRRRLPPADRGGPARGGRVSVVSTLRSSPPMVADELRRQADTFIELQDLAPQIARAPRQTENRVRPRRGRISLTVDID